MPLPKRTDKSKFVGVFAVTFLRFRFYWFRFLLRRGDLRSPASNAPINQNLKNYPPPTTYPRPKINGPRKEKPREERSLPPANTGRAHSGMGGPCSHSPHWATKNLFPKRFWLGFFLKKATLRAAAPPRQNQTYFSTRVDNRQNMVYNDKDLKRTRKGSIQ